MATNNAINRQGIRPAFEAVNNVDQTNVTGDGSVYSVIFSDVLFNTGSFDGTSTFTASITGQYLFEFRVFLSGLTVAMDSVCNLVTTGATYCIKEEDYSSNQFTSTYYAFSFVALVPMTATDTAYITIAVNGGAKVVSLVGKTATARMTPQFCGCIVSGII